MTPSPLRRPLPAPSCSMPMVVPAPTRSRDRTGPHLERDGRKRRQHRRPGGVVPLHRSADRRDCDRHLQRQGFRDRRAHRQRRRRRRYAQLRRRGASRVGRYDATGRSHRLAGRAVGHLHADRTGLPPQREQHPADDHPDCQSDHPGEQQVPPHWPSRSAISRRRPATSPCRGARRTPPWCRPRTSCSEGAARAAP